MATYEHNALQQYKDSSNNMHVIYPVTKAECIADPQNLSVGNANTVGGKAASDFANSSHTHKKSEITDFPTSMTPTAHTHTKSQITDFPTSLPASDVYSWAKASAKPSYSWSEITSKPTSFTPASHNQGAHTITAGTFAGKVRANETAQASLSDAQCRDIMIIPKADTPTEGATSYYPKGTIVFVRK